MFRDKLKFLPLFWEVNMTRIICLNVKGGSELGILQVWRNTDAFFLDLFKDCLGGMIHSSWVFKFLSCFTPSLMSRQIEWSLEALVTLLACKTIAVLVHVLDVAEMIFE